MYYMKHIQNPVYWGKFSGVLASYSDIFSHIVAYFKKPLCNSCIFRILAYLEPCHIQDPGIFRTLPYSEPELHQNPVYLGIFRHIQCDSYNNIGFLFFTLILYAFQRNLKRHIFWLQWRYFDARLSLLK